MNALIYQLLYLFIFLLRIIDLTEMKGNIILKTKGEMSSMERTRTVTIVDLLGQINLVKQEVTLLEVESKLLKVILLKRILRCFEALSGLKVNLLKSTLVPCGADSGLVQQWAIYYQKQIGYPSYTVSWNSFRSESKSDLNLGPCDR